MLPKTQPDDWVTLPEAARLADVTERWMRELVQGGRVVGLKVGRNYIVSRASAAAYVRSETEGRPRAVKPKRAARKRR
jgi:siroheme synthase